jgi:hypothetical protein
MHINGYLTYHGSFSPTTRAIPTISFIEKYSRAVDTLSLSSPYHSWYAPTAIFHNANGTVYSGGDAIWTWMRGLFSPFIAINHDIKTIRVFGAREGEISGGKIEVEGEVGDAEWVVLETETSFWLKDGKLRGEAVKVPRLLMFLVGPSEVGMGTDGLWILDARVWWDSGVLSAEVERRRAESTIASPHSSDGGLK